LTRGQYFHILGNMETDSAVLALEALAQNSRLAIFRLLVEAGPQGLAAGGIAERMELPAATLSFHLSQLKNAGLLACRRDGRSLIYSADFDSMNELVGFLTDNCCGGKQCGPVARAAQRKGKTNATARRASRRR
jgi:DNA-binding transcriptional ArsR family regulator